MSLARLRRDEGRCGEACDLLAPVSSLVAATAWPLTGAAVAQCSAGAQHRDRRLCPDGVARESSLPERIAFLDGP